MNKIRECFLFFLYLLFKNNSMKITAEDFKNYTEEDLRQIVVCLLDNIHLLPRPLFYFIKQDEDSIKIKKRIDKCYNLVKEEILVRFLDNDNPIERYVPVKVKDFHVLVDTKTQQKDLVKGDAILFTHNDGEKDIYIYDCCDGYGMGAYDLNNQRCTIAYSHCCKIVTTIDKTIEKLPTILPYNSEVINYTRL